MRTAARVRSVRTHSLPQLESVRHCSRKTPKRIRHSRSATHEPGRISCADGPGHSLAVPGAARDGCAELLHRQVPDPPFLLPIYQAAGMQYGVRWEVLAAINEIETDYGRNLNISSAGAVGWMQFMPPTWAAYGVDANGDGVKDPFNPVDAIFAAARYLQRRRRRHGHPPRRVRLQPRRLVRRLRAHARPGHRRPAERPRRLPHRPHAGPLPDPGEGDLRRPAQQEGQQGPAGQRGDGRGVRRPPAAASRSSPAPTRL